MPTLAYVDLDLLPVRVLYGRVITLYPYILYKLRCQAALSHATSNTQSAAIQPAAEKELWHTGTQDHNVVFTSGKIISMAVEYGKSALTAATSSRSISSSKQSPASVIAQLYRSKLRRAFNHRLLVLSTESMEG